MKFGGAAGQPGWLAGWLACRLKFIDLIVKVIQACGCFFLRYVLVAEARSPRAFSQVRADAPRARVHARAALPDAREEEGAARLAPAEAHAVEHLALVPGVLTHA